MASLAVVGRVTGYPEDMEPSARVSHIHGSGPSQPPGASSGSPGPSHTPDVSAQLTALRDAVASEDRAEDLVLTKTKNVATVAGAFIAISQPVVFSTDVLGGPSTFASRAVVFCAVGALVCLAVGIWRVFEQQKPANDHKGLPRDDIGKDLFDVLHANPRTEVEQAEAERQAIRKLAQHYAGVAGAKSARTSKLADDYRAIVKLCTAAVVLVAVEFAIALISQG